MGNENEIIVRRDGITLHIVSMGKFKLTSEQLKDIVESQDGISIKNAIHDMTDDVSTIKSFTMWGKALSSEELYYLTGGKLALHNKLMNWFNKLIRKL